MTGVLTSMRLALAFLTRIPVPIGPVSPPQLGAAVAFFPLVGAAIGGLQLLALALLPSSLDRVLGGIVLVALSAAVTGALHLDGLADVFDGLGGGRGDSSRMLEIMRDPRIGAHGATALALVLLAKVYASATLIAQGSPEGLFIAPICARLAAAASIRAFPYARSEGAGRSFRDHAAWKHVAFAALTTALAIVGTDWTLVGAALVGFVLAAGLAFWVSWRARGLTGDAYGAVVEICETGVLIAAGVSTTS